MKTWMWGLAAAVGAYFLYEWAQTQCATVGSSLYGGTICGWLPAASTVAAASTAATPSTTTAAQAALLAAYGLPADAVPSSMPISGNSCSVVNPAQSGYNPVPGAAFYSPSLGTYMCGPASLATSMSANPAPVVTPTPVASTPMQTAIPEASQWNAGPQGRTVVIIRNAPNFPPNQPPMTVAPLIPGQGNNSPGVVVAPTGITPAGISGLGMRRRFA
jgi:hypothetical protein